MALPVNFAKNLGVGRGTVVKEFFPGGVIAAKDSVMFRLASSDEGRILTVIQATNGAADDVLFAGIALEAAAAASTTVPIKVAVAGYVEGATTDGSVASGSPLCLDVSGTAGALGAGAIGTNHIVGIGVEIDTGTVGDVYLFGQGMAGGL